ncbi:hypothetical protein L6164_007208 [Bauhinia variegata]|uniref:Uncharacterized protein n=1 Tax=Bauhinia variegata TaxID=167791 RepID=A0ACB9PEA0_BAUVA|nr:hypothetical protein L6164_007208 [Bauhinia variegata]
MYRHSISWSLESKKLFSVKGQRFASYICSTFTPQVWIATESGSLEVTYTHNEEHALDKHMHVMFLFFPYAWKATQELVSNFASDPFRPLMTLLEYRGLLTESVGGMITYVAVAVAVAVQKMFC